MLPPPPPPTPHPPTHQSELESLSSRVQEIIEENSKLHTELRKSLEAQLQSSMGQGGGASSGVGGVSTVIVGGLQQQLDLLSKERDSYVELWRQTTSELDTLQKSEQVYNSSVVVIYTRSFLFNMRSDGKLQYQEYTREESTECAKWSAQNVYGESHAWNADYLSTISK